MKSVIFEKDTRNGIARITINRPEARNALNRAVRLELKDALDDIGEDKNVRVAVMTGAGDAAFISGADVAELKDATPTEIEEFVSTLGQALFARIESLRVPVIAMINGSCFGAGMEVAMCCDIRVASEAARFGQLEINLGIFPGGGATQRLPRLVGWGRAKELIYTGRIIDSAEAQRIGFVDRVVPKERLQEEVTRLAETIAVKSPTVVAYAKQAINRGMYTDLAAGLAHEKAMFALCFATPDHLIAMAAFLEKGKAKATDR